MEILCSVLLICFVVVVEVFYLVPALSFWVSFRKMRKMKKNIEKGDVDAVLSQLVK